MTRETFGSLRAGGLDWDSLPLRLWTKGNRRWWNAADVDLSRDRADWDALDDEERRATRILCSMFIAGEEAVTEDIQPFLGAMRAEGRLGDEMYLAQFCYEEARHTEAFRRWLDAIGVTEDLHTYVADNPGYRTLFYEALPAALGALDADPSPAAQVRASVTYNHVVEGTLALTGYHAWRTVCSREGIMPGVAELVRLIALDERRHMAWGTYTCRRHVAADPSLWQVVEETFGAMLPLALDAARWPYDSFVEPPFGLTLEELLAYAGERATRRLAAIESAVGQGAGAADEAGRTELDRDRVAEDLEEAIGEEDDSVIGAHARSVTPI